VRSNPSSPPKKGKWCPSCGKKLTLFKDARCYVCTHCAYTEYFLDNNNKEQQQQLTTSLRSPNDDEDEDVATLDGLNNDMQTRPAVNPATKFRSKWGPRKSEAKPDYANDEDLMRFMEKVGGTIKSYVERVEKTSDVVTPSELRDLRWRRKIVAAAPLMTLPSSTDCVLVFEKEFKALMTQMLRVYFSEDLLFLLLSHNDTSMKQRLKEGWAIDKVLMSEIGMKDIPNVTALKFQIR
jgi:hypothetical protein